MRLEDRQQILENTYNKREFFTLSSMAYFQFFKSYFEASLEADLHPNGDITTTLLNENLPAKVEGKVIAKEDGVLSGLEEVKYMAKQLGVGFSLGKNSNGKKFESGMNFQKGDTLFSLSGSPLKLLQGERTILNFLQRMCGIVTAASKFETEFTKVAVTRKTPLPLLDKRAAIDGGALPHRVNLSDAIMIKDTHLDQFGRDFEALADFLKDRSYQGISFIEIEVSGEHVVEGSAVKGQKEALEVAKMAKNLDLDVPMVVMLDNFTPKAVKSTVLALQEAKLYDYVLIEVSGGITRENYKNYDIEGVDVMSVGEITHSVGVCDLSMKI